MSLNTYIDEFWYSHTVLFVKVKRKKKKKRSEEKAADWNDKIDFALGLE